MNGPELKTSQMAEVWMMARELKQFTVPELTVASGVADTTVQHMVSRWATTGYVKGDGKPRNQRFEVVDRTPQAFGPRDKRMWQMMRSMKTFAARDIALWSSQTDDEVTQSEAQRYIRHLLDADYLRVREVARRGERPERYQLIRDTGPKPPVAKRIQAVYDPNTAEITPNRRFRAQEGLS